MAEIGVRERLLVKDVMSSPVITAEIGSTIEDVAKLMENHKIGSVVVVNGEGNPIGLITERDIVIRVVAKGLNSKNVRVEEIMTPHILTINPDEPLIEAARRMSKLNIRRLGVMYKGKLVGLISSRDILSVMPELIEILVEKARIEGEIPESPPMAGYCDNCGRWSDDLKEVEGRFLCKECRIELELEK